MSSIFILRLEDGYYYIGNSEDAVQSFHELTKVLPYKPLGFEKIIEGATIYDLIYQIKWYYNIYGRDKVLSSISIDEQSKKKQIIDIFNQNLSFIIHKVRRIYCINRCCPQEDIDSD